MWKECTSYVNHRKIYLNLGQLWYRMFLIGFRILASLVLYTLSAMHRGTHQISCPSTVPVSRVHVEGDPPHSLHCRALGHCLLPAQKFPPCLL